LVHGYGADGLIAWESQLEAFLQAGFAVYVPDLLFFGQSISSSNGPFSVKFQADCLRELLELLGVAFPVNVVGTSYGGLVSVYLASMYPALVHKVVIASVGVVMDAADAAALEKKMNVDDMMLFLLPTTVEGVKATLKFLLLKPPRMPDSAYQEILEVTYLKNRREKVELYHDSGMGTDKAFSRPTLTQEVLLVWGEKDRLFPIEQGLKLQKHLGSNRAQLVVLKNVGHTPQNEDPRAFNDAVFAFLLKDEWVHMSSKL
jgi:pimeloyl-ACP methyl ester carboxylesterase